MLSGVAAVLLAAARSGAGSSDHTSDHASDPTGILGLALALFTLYLTLRPPRRLPVVWVLAASSLVLAAWLILAFFTVSVPVRIVICAVLLVAYLSWTVGVRARVSKPHRRELERILDTADEAIKARKSVSLNEQQRSELSCHFKSVSEDLATWNGLVGAEENSRQKLRDAMCKRLDKLAGDAFGRTVLGDGLLAITVARAFDAKLGEPLPEMLNTSDAIFRAWPGPGGVGGIIVFDEDSGARGTVYTFPNDALPPGAVGARAEAVLPPVYTLLDDVQGWDYARALVHQHAAVEEFPRGQLQKRIRAARRRKFVRRVRSCPVCAREPAAQP